MPTRNEQKLKGLISAIQRTANVLNHSDWPEELADRKAKLIERLNDPSIGHGNKKWEYDLAEVHLLQTILTARQLTIPK